MTDEAAPGPDWLDGVARVLRDELVKEVEAVNRAAAAAAAAAAVAHNV